MKIYNQDKTEILINPDLTKGYLINDEIRTYVPSKKGIEEQWHYEYKYYENGGSERFKVVDVPGVPDSPEYEDCEEILVYIPYTEEELVKIKQEQYEELIVSKIRQKYTLNQELAILRQRDTKPEEFTEYNDYVEQCKIEVKEELNDGDRL